MADVNGVEVVLASGEVELHPEGRHVDVDGFGDYVIRDANREIVATAKRASTEKIRRTYAT